MNKLARFFIGKYLEEDVDLFERARAIMFFRFLLAFSILFIFPVLADISLNLPHALVKHSVDLFAIIALLFSLRYFKTISHAITIFFTYSFLTYLLAVMILNPERTDAVTLLWSMFFFSLSTLLQRGWTRIIYCCFLGWIPIFYVLINIHLNGALTIHAITDTIPPDPPVFLISIPIILIIIAIWSHTNTINTARVIITQQKKLLEEKNTDITNSIQYAKRIQESKLPDKSTFKNLFPESFILFKPKDIVSGDFYFFQKNKDSLLVAAADCTGHGVPGAIMSMICSEKLEEAVSISENPSEILSIVNRRVKVSLKQTDEEDSTRDGMDIALCSVDTANGIVKYAGANRPLWIIRNGQNSVEEIKATKSAIGGRTADDKQFDGHDIKLQQGDTFYIFTDGYADQFHGKTGKKMMTKKLKEVLIDIQTKTMQEQEKYLNDFVENWKGGQEQIDDILVIGVRL